MTPEMIEEIASLLNRRGLEAIEFEQGNAALRMVRGEKRPSNVIHAPSSEAAEPVAKAIICRSPGMGFLRLVHPQREAPNVAVGVHVGDGETLAYLQCGALLREVTANCAGTVKQLLAVEGELVGFGQPLFEFE